jgi:hypothetical protein
MFAYAAIFDHIELTSAIAAVFVFLAILVMDKKLQVRWRIVEGIFFGVGVLLLVAGALFAVMCHDGILVPGDEPSEGWEAVISYLRYMAFVAVIAFVPFVIGCVVRSFVLRRVRHENEAV